MVNSDLPQPETRGIFGTGPWHVKAISYIRSARARALCEPLSRGQLVVALAAIDENAQCRLDDLYARVQNECAVLSGMIDDLARVNEYDIHRARFAAMVELAIRLEEIRATTV